MKKIFILFFIILTSSLMYAQKVEKLGEIKEIRYRASIGGGPDSPNLIAVNEVENIIKINSITKNNNSGICFNQKKNNGYLFMLMRFPLCYRYKWTYLFGR